MNLLRSAVRVLDAVRDALPHVRVSITVGSLAVIFPFPAAVDCCECEDCDEDPDGPDDTPVYRASGQALHSLLMDAAHRSHNGDDPEAAADAVLLEVELSGIEADAEEAA